MGVWAYRRDSQLGHLDPLNLSFLRTNLSPQTPENKELKQ